MKHTKHAERFTKNLKRSFMLRFIWEDYIKNKYDAIDPYKYHLVIENHKSKYHFTEKITDSIVFQFTMDANIDYFPINSYIEIDINNYEES